MSNSTKTLDVKILDRELRIACPEEERAELMDAVAYLDKKMREIHETGKIASIERIALMAALNISHDLLRLKNERSTVNSTVERRTHELTQRVEAALAEARQLSL